MDALARNDDPAELYLRLKQLNDIGVALSGETDIARLLEAILVAAKTITNADGGTLYRVTDDRMLRFEIVRNDTLAIAMGGTTGAGVPFQPIALYTPNGVPVTSMVAAYTVHHGHSVNIADAYRHEDFDFSGTKHFDEKTGYRSRSFLTVPMKDHESTTIGVLQLINAKDRTTGVVGPFTDADRHLAESLASQAAIALTNRLLINRLEELFESFIGVINAAIDDKSPYTSGHCQRVPILTMLRADAVDACQVGPLKGFSMTERDRRELKIAGLLHDCGKVTTPVHIVDKATKLQTLFDRIELIDTRWEIVKRDMELELAGGRLAAVGHGGGRQAPAALERNCERRLAEIEADRAFLRQCNIGGERMRAEEQERVRQISERYRWRDGSGNEHPLLTAGEIESLTVPAGTLTREERRIVNHHIDVTIRMLEALPWPRHLTRVPEYAGGHHERMDGKGYPRGLKREEMSVQARCMGIADIFEALTAADRPYKKGKTLSESLRILGKFKLNGHIDPDLFDVFMWQKVYVTYAAQCMDPAQIDAVDPSKIPGYVDPPRQ